MVTYSTNYARNSSERCKVKKREYGPAGTATEQWVALGKRAAASGGGSKKKAKAA